MSEDSSTKLPLPPFLRRRAQRQLPEIQEAVARVCRSGCFLFGDELAAFERELADSLGSPEAVGTGSGTDAIHLALRALDIGPGDEVITQSHSSPFTVIAIRMAGARAVLVDSSEDDFGMDVAALERALSPRTKAILPVHLYGHPVRIREIVEIAAAAGVAVVEDCAQAQGASVGGRAVGTFGALGCFSFYPTKNLGALGDGGAVITGDAALAERVRLLRNGGLAEPGIHAACGITSRLDEVQAAVLRLRLRDLDAGNEARREHARAYDRALSGVRKPSVLPGCRWAPHQYVIRHAQREAIRAAAAAQGVPLSVHYPLPIHLQPGFHSAWHASGSLQVAERLAAEVLSLPTHPEMTAAERDQLIAGLQDTVTHLQEPTWKSSTS